MLPFNTCVRLYGHHAQWLFLSVYYQVLGKMYLFVNCISFKDLEFVLPLCQPALFLLSILLSLLHSHLWTHARKEYRSCLQTFHSYIYSHLDILGWELAWTNYDNQLTQFQEVCVASCIALLFFCCSPSES